MIPLKDENPGQTFPLVTIGIIAANVAVFLYQLTLSGPELHRFATNYGMIPAELLGLAPRIHSSLPPALTLLTSQFVHGGFLHIGGNMLYLWIFGNNIEDVLGRFRFLLFYLVCGVIAGASHMILDPHSAVPMIGASGAIAGVLGAYLITFPGTRVLVLVFLLFFVTTVRIQAFWVLGFWFVMQLFYATSSVGGGAENVAYVAHVGGFLAGIWLVRRLRPGLKWRKLWR